MDEIKIVHPKNIGWLEARLSNEELSYLWECIDNRETGYPRRLPNSVKPYLAGNIRESNRLIDKDDWFFQNTLLPLCKAYSENFVNLGNSVPTNNSHPYCLSDMWVNFQSQGDFNPFHNHHGVYSFAIWMKIPTIHSEQNENPIAKNSNYPMISVFQFTYTNILGEFRSFSYEQNPDREGTILFFPSKLTHCVYPFFNCNEERITISGNLSLNTTKPF